MQYIAIHVSCTMIAFVNTSNVKVDRYHFFPILLIPSTELKIFTDTDSDTDTNPYSYMVACISHQMSYLPLGL